MDLLLSQRLKIVVSALEGGQEIETNGHKLAIVEGQTEPGFVVSRYSLSSGDPRLVETGCCMIGSDTAWLYVIDFAKTASDEDLFAMAANKALNKKTYSERKNWRLRDTGRT